MSDEKNPQPAENETQSVFQGEGTPQDEKTTLALAGVLLQDDEKLLALSVIHPAIYWKGAAVFLLGLALLPGFAANLGLFLLLVGVSMLGIAWLTRRFLILAATDKRIVARSGILYTDMIEMRYATVESIEIGITPVGQMFGYGSVIVTGTGQRRIVVSFIRNARDFRNLANVVLVNK